MFILDPGSWIWIFSIPDPGIKKAPDPESGSAILDVCCVFFQVTPCNFGFLIGSVSLSLYCQAYFLLCFYFMDCCPTGIRTSEKTSKKYFL
jgi:hypothetical protein